jgi:hypothetical protein
MDWEGRGERGRVGERKEGGEKTKRETAREEPKQCHRSRISREQEGVSRIFS